MEWLSKTVILVGLVISLMAVIYIIILIFEKKKPIKNRIRYELKKKILSQTEQ